ncbi:MAG TPA: hypothetical protein VF972_05395, partial [Actinomycetota bacterium]
MSDQESQIRELLQELAEDVPVPHTAPTSLLRRAARRRVRTVMVAVLAVGAGAAIGMSLLTRAGTPPPNVRERAGTELVPQLVSTVDLPAHPSRISVGAGSLWVVNKDDGSQSQFDPTTGRKIGKVVRSSSVDITAANDQVVAYSASGSRSAVTVFDRNHRSIETVPLPGASRPLGRVAIGPHALWVARWALGGRAPGQVMKIISKRIVATIEVSPGEGGLAVGPDAIWVTDARRGLLQRI